MNYVKATSESWVHVGWKCSKCGRYNAKTLDFSASYSGTGTLKSTRDAVSAKAQMAAVAQAVALWEGAQRGVYHPAFGRCVCKDCKNREPWGGVGEHRQLWIARRILMVVLGIATGFSVLSSDWLASLLCGGLLAFVIVGGILLKQRFEKKAKELQPLLEYLKDTEKPILARTSRELQAKMCEIHAKTASEKNKITKIVDLETFQ